MVFKKVFLFVGIIISLLIPALGVQAYDAPRVYIKEVNLPSGPIGAGSAINGDFKVWNYTDGVLSNLSYSVSLRINNTIFKEEIFPLADPLNAKETREQKISFIVPQNIRTDEYDLRIQFFTESGVALSWENKKISIEGNGVSLYISDVFLLKGGTEVNPFRGENFSSDIVPQVKFIVINSSEQAITFNPIISIYDMQISGKELRSISLSGETLAPGEKKEIVAALEQFTKPTSYLGKINLYIGGETVSSIGEFRWVVEGEGARITNITIDKNEYIAGEEIKITVDLVGPADNKDIGEGNLFITVFDPVGKIIAVEEKKVMLNSSNVKQTFNIIAESDLIKPKIEVKIYKGDQELSSYTVNKEKPAEVIVEIPATEKEINYMEFLFVMAVAIVLVLVTLKFLKRKKIPVGLIIIIGIALFGGCIEKAEAFTIANTWNKPMPNPPPDIPYDPGDPITFQGAYANYACSNEITDIKVSSYICDANEDHCISTGNYYPAWLSDLAYDSVNKKIYASNSEGNSVVRLDFNTKNIEARYGMEDAQPGEFGYPWDTVFVASTGYIYATDSAVSRLIRFNPANKEGTWEDLGSLGSGIGQFNSPKGIYYDLVQNYIYVADSLNNRIVRFKPNDAVWTANWESFGTYGNYGSGAGRFNKPEGVSFDPSSGYVYVGDTENYRIVRFKPLNNGIGGYSNWRIFGDGSWGHDNNSFIRPSGVYYSSASQYVYVAEASGYAVSMFKPDVADWTTTMDRVTDGNTYSQDPGGFAVVQDIFYDSGYVYLIDSYRGIVKFQQGNVLATWSTYGSKGVGKGKFTFPIGFNYDVSTGYMYVADSNNKRIVKFDYSGGSGTWLPFGSASDLEGSFNKPSGVFYDEGNNHLYVADSNSSRVVRFTPNANGTFSDWNSWGSYGTGNGQFIEPTGIYFDASAQLLYVSDVGRDQIIKFKPQAGGNIVQWKELGSHGDGIGKFNDPSGIYLDSGSGYLYIANMWGTSIIRFKPGDADMPVNNWTANWRSYGNGWGTGVGQFEMPMNVYYDATAGQEYLYVADFNNGRVVRFRPDDAVWTANWKTYGTVGAGSGQFEYVSGVFYDTAENHLYVADSYRGGYADDNTRVARFDPNGNTVGNFAGNWDTMDTSFREYLINTNVPLSFGPGFVLGVNGLARAKVVVEGFTLETGRLRTLTESYEDIYLSGTVANTPPAVSGLITNESSVNYCIESFLGINLIWDFTDAEDAAQTSYRIEVDRNDGVFYDSGVVDNINTLVNGSYIKNDAAAKFSNGDADGFLRYNTGGGENYSWEVTVYDSKGASSSPVSGPVFSFPRHQFPSVGFTPPPPASFTVSIPIEFKVYGNANSEDNSKCYPAGDNTDCNQWIWDFDYDGAIFTSDKIIGGIDGNWSHSYSTPSTFYKVVLQVRDKDGNVCSNSHSPEIVGINRLNWQEVSPVTPE